jgi:MFS family permease
LIAGHTLQALGYSSMLLLPLYLAHLDASRREIGQIMAVASVGGLLLRPAMGFSLDHFGRRKTIVAGTLCLAAGMAGFSLVTEVDWLVYLVRILVGVGSGTLFTAYFTFASDVIPERRRTEGLALFGVSGILPLILNPIAQSAGIDPPALRTYYPMLGGVILLSILPVLAIGEPPRPAAARPAELRSIFDAMTSRSLRSTWFATIVFSGFVSVYMAFATVSAEHRGLASPASIWFTYAGGAIAIRSTGGKALDRFGPKRMIPASLLVFAVAYVLTAVDGGWPLLLLASLGAGLGHGLGFPVLAAEAVTRSPADKRGSSIAALTALWDVGALLLTPAFGAIADATSDAGLFSSGAFAALAGIALWRLLDRSAARPAGPGE